MLSQVIVEPLYEKVKKQLLDYIEKAKPGVLPREKDLIKLFGVSRNTVRHAVQDLTRAGVLKPVQGRGTIVLKHAEEKACDIGVICTDSLDIGSPWISTMLKSLQQQAHADGYHLNLFLCHDYSIDPLNNSAYSYLVNSGKVAGLILLSALKPDDIEHIKSIGLPFVTVDFQYRAFDHPSSVPDIVDAVSRIIDEYAASGITRFGILAKPTEVLDANDCRGQNDFIIENWKSMLKAKKLPVPGDDFNGDIEAQIMSLYALPSDQRPQVIFTPFIPYFEKSQKVLGKLEDWNPIHVKTVMRACAADVPCIIASPSVQARKAFTILNKIISIGKLSSPEECKTYLEYKLK
jgi:DNA-binding LacI/PurR family transcriptional regulator